MNLVARPSVERFESSVLEEYRRRTHITPRSFVSAPADGARVLEEA